MSNHKNCNLSFFCFPYTGFLLYFLSKRVKIFFFFFLIHKSCFVITERLVSLWNGSAFQDSLKWRGGGQKINFPQKSDGPQSSCPTSPSGLLETSKGRTDGEPHAEALGGGLGAAKSRLPAPHGGHVYSGRGPGSHGPLACGLTRRRPRFPPAASQHDFSSPSPPGHHVPPVTGTSTQTDAEG